MMENMGIRLYNKEPDDTKKLDSFKSFKREFKKFCCIVLFIQWMDLRLFGLMRVAKV
jgi:hypothetical protein